MAKGRLEVVEPVCVVGAFVESVSWTLVWAVELMQVMVFAATVADFQKAVQKTQQQYDLRKQFREGVASRFPAICVDGQRLPARTDIAGLFVKHSIGFQP